MLTPQEVSQHAFAKANFGGYNMAMVDEFLDQLTEDYTALYKENAVLKSKMKVLVDKVEEYRATEDGMRKALLAAQRTADDMIAEAERKKDELMKTAEAEARAKIEGLRHELESEQLRLTAAQNATAAYVSKLKELYQHEMEYLNSLSGLTAPGPSPADKAAKDIESSMQKLMAEEAPAPAPEEPPEDTLDLSELQAEGPEAEKEGDGGLYAELLELNLDRGAKKPEERRDPERHAARRYEEEDDEEPADGPEDDSPTQRIDFDNLKFGKDFKF